jgi:Zn-dependent M28 family amino/carboxypeptidase
MLMVALSACASQPPSEIQCDDYVAVTGQPLVSQQELMQMLAAAPATNVDREQRLEEELNSAGCNQLSIGDVRGSQQNNVICMLPGRFQRSIVVGAHFDKQRRSGGVADNWSGATLLPVLFRELAVRPRNQGVWLVGFAEEEKNLQGATSFVRTLSASQLDETMVMVNLDTLGLGPLRLDPRSTNKFSKQVDCAARVTDLEKISAKHLPETSGDWQPFRAAGVPVLNFHSLDRTKLKVIHSPRDNLGAIHGEDYYQTYLFLRQLLLNLADQ